MSLLKLAKIVMRKPKVRLKFIQVSGEGRGIYEVRRYGVDTGNEIPYDRLQQVAMFPPGYRSPLFDKR